jgi:hypothetical protein
MEYFGDEFEMVDEHVPHQSRIWRLIKAIPQEKIERIRDYTLDKAERLALLDRLVEKSTPHSRPMMEVVRLWQHCLDKDYDSARQDIARMRSIYDVDGGAELWFRQAIQVEQHMQKAQR